MDALSRVFFLIVRPGDFDKLWQKPFQTLLPAASLVVCFLLHAHRLSCLPGFCAFTSTSTRASLILMKLYSSGGLGQYAGDLAQVLFNLDLPELGALVEASKQGRAVGFALKVSTVKQYPQESSSFAG